MPRGCNETDIAAGEQAGMWWAGEGEKHPSDMGFERGRGVVVALE